MCSNAGIVYIVFGTEYDKLAAYTIGLSRQNTKLPIAIFTNLLPEERSSEWNEVPDVTFRYFDLPTNDNRSVKTRLYRYSPFENTIYIDCDTVIQRPGIDIMVNYAKNNGLCLQLARTWQVETRCARLYVRAARRFRAALPLPIYLGGFFSFNRKHRQVQNLFDTWYTLWRDGGAGRDMPALAIAAQRVGFYPKVIHGSDNIFSFGLSDTAIVVHRAHPDDLHERFGAPQYEMNKLFDKPGDWDKLYFNIEQNSTEDETTHFSNPKHDQETRYHRNNHEGTDDSKVHGQTGDASLPIVV